LLKVSNFMLSIFSASNPPVILSVSAIDSQSVNVTWRAPTQPNGVITSYTIMYTTDELSNITVPYVQNVSKFYVFCHLYTVYSVPRHGLPNANHNF